MYNEILVRINKRNIDNYNIDMPQSFKDKYPELFVEETEGLPKDIVDKYYSKQLTISDVFKYKDILRNKSCANSILSKYGISISDLTDEKLNSFADDFADIFTQLDVNETTIAYCFGSYSLYTNEVEKIAVMDKVLWRYRGTWKNPKHEFDLKEIALFSKLTPIDWIVNDKKNSNILRKFRFR